MRTTLPQNNSAHLPTKYTDLQHNLMCLTFDGKLHISPAGVEKPLHRVLDAGTGTGIWALDFGTFHLVG